MFYDGFIGADLLNRQFPGCGYSQRRFILPFSAKLLLVVPLNVLLVQHRLLLILVKLQELLEGKHLLTNVRSGLIEGEWKMAKCLHNFDCFSTNHGILEILFSPTPQKFEAFTLIQT